MNRWVTAALSVLLLLASNPSWARSADDRIADMERQLADIQKTYMVNNQDSAAAVARMNEIADSFNSVKGQSEAAAHQIESQREELMRLIADLQARVQAIEDRAGILSSGVASAPGKMPTFTASDAAIYQQGIDLYNSTKYLEAASAFESFIQKDPKGQYVANARRWIAECFYASRDYKRAIKEYQTFIEKFPKDPKIPEAIFKQGNSFYELGMLDESKPFFQKVISVYPKSPEAAQAKAKLTRIEEKKKAPAPAQPAVPAVKPAAPAASPGASAASPTQGMGSYPTETIEQKRQKMSGAPPPPPQKDPAKATAAPYIPHRDF
ncbi:MAG: tol-pal system protein YbgF [Pseudomonadota bacterium]